MAFAGTTRLTDTVRPSILVSVPLVSLATHTDRPAAAPEAADPNRYLPDDLVRARLEHGYRVRGDMGQIAGRPRSSVSSSTAIAATAAKYECLAGAPPFRRTTEAETLWARVQESRRRCPGSPCWTRCSKRRWRREETRYASCGELLAAACSALASRRPPAAPDGPP